MPIKQNELGEPLINALGRLGGSATKQQVLRAMEVTIGAQLDTDDWALLTSRREARWHNRVAFARDSLVKEGLLLNNERDEWQLSADGRDYYRDFETPGFHAAGVHEPADTHLSPVYDFKPKDSSEYLARTDLRIQLKARSHEDLVERFAKWAHKDGFDVSNPHPQDLLLRKEGRIWLVEAKIVYLGDASAAARAALAQLLDYRFFIHNNDLSVRLVALFNEDLGAGYRAYLAAQDIQPVWPAGERWTDGGVARFSLT